MFTNWLEPPVLGDTPVLVRKPNILGSEPGVSPESLSSNIPGSEPGVSPES